MVYQKDDGSYGFSWKKQYEFLLAEHPMQLEEIVDARFEILAEDNPEKSAYYKGLRADLAAKIDDAWDNDDDFGWLQSCRVTKAFVKERNLMSLFFDVPALSSEIDQQIDDSSQSDDPEDDEIKLNFTGDDFDQWLQLL